MSWMLTRFATAASFLVLLAACGANDAGSGGKGPRGNAPDDGFEDPSDGVGGQGGDDWSDDQPDSGSNIDPDAACAATSMESQAVPPAVMFQLDYSGSMKCTPTEPGSASCAGGPGSRWFILRDALKEALEKIPAQAHIGLMHYPAGLYDGINFCQASQVDAALAPPSRPLTRLKSRADSTRSAIPSAVRRRTPLPWRPFWSSTSFLEATSSSFWPLMARRATASNAVSTKRSAIWTRTT